MCSISALSAGFYMYHRVRQLDIPRQNLDKDKKQSVLFFSISQFTTMKTTES